MTEPRELLRKYFGHGQFRPGQEPILQALLSGQDVLGVMPTGAGKSICYQLPALLLPGVTLVVSPLISLMKDQVEALRSVGIPAAAINSSLSAAAYREVFYEAASGVYKILYVAPERLLTVDFLHLTEQIEISLVAVDEAHCVSQWGQDFRPSYLKIPEFLAALPRRPVVGAFTATATSVVKADIEKILGLRQPLRFTTGFDRPNLYFSVVQTKQKDLWLQQFIHDHAGESGIIYAATRKRVESVCDNLRSCGIPATRYHAGLSDEERLRNQEDFVYDRAQVMVATNAFGMGIDKSNVSFVIHYNMPQNIESYYQEAGRAGRDGAPAQCVLLYAAGDVQIARFLLNHSAENELLTPEEREFVRKQEFVRLDQMIEYCKTKGCLRNYLLRYFGEHPASDCGNCGNCQGELVTRDITVEAQKILSGVYRVERKYRRGLGVTLIVRMLHGSRDQRVLALELDRLSTYGILRNETRTQIRLYIDQLLSDGYLQLMEGEYPVLRLTSKARSVLHEGERVYYRYLEHSEKPDAAIEEDVLFDRPREKRRAVMPIPEDGEEENLLSALRRLRIALAKEMKVPAYVIFSNATLLDMAEKRPTNLEELLEVSGVGEVKAARYGERFLAEIEKWV